MQLRLCLNSQQWQARWTQCGAPSGWSAWEPIDRLAALRYIERGFTFEYQEA